MLATSRAEDRQSIGIASLYSSLPSSSAKWLRRIPKFDTGAWHPWGTQSAPGVISRAVRSNSSSSRLSTSLLSRLPPARHCQPDRRPFHHPTSVPTSVPRALQYLRPLLRPRSQTPNPISSLSTTVRPRSGISRSTIANSQPYRLRRTTAASTDLRNNVRHHA